MPESNSKPSKTTIPNLMDVTMEKIRDMVDVETIIGDPITVGTDVTIIPISKVSYGFASGGSDLPAKVPKDLFGGGTGAGISIQPVGFLVVQNGDVRLLQMTEGNGDTANSLIRTLPEVISKVSGLVKSKKKSGKSSDDATTDEEA